MARVVQRARVGVIADAVRERMSALAVHRTRVGSAYVSVIAILGFSRASSARASVLIRAGIGVVACVPVGKHRVRTAR